MAVTLRTRLFLVVAVLLGASIVVSALLSRTVTLVEMRTITEKPRAPEQDEPLLADLVAIVHDVPPAALTPALTDFASAHARRAMVVGPGNEVVAASDRHLAAARVTTLTADGILRAEVGDPVAQMTMELHGMPMRTVEAAGGSTVTVLLLPPAEIETVSRRPVPLWVWTTIATGIVAVPLVFASARRILGPIGALTDAANRMQAGERHVRVDVKGTDELAELGRAFNGMAARLAETERLRKQLISDVAHELRSPVTNLRCMLESIQDGLAAPDRANIDALHEETLFLQRLITDLQDLTLADAGQLTMRSEAVDLRLVLGRAVAAAAAGGGAAIRTDPGERLPAVQGDPDRLEQVFRNLLANAVTHTPHDGVIIVRAQAAGPRVVIEVIDTGCGIPADHLPHVFDRFYRVDGSRSRATGGAGLGLAIARQLVEAHGGSITVASGGAGAGACFSVTLPVAD